MVHLRSLGLPVVFDPELERTIIRNTFSRHFRQADSMTSNPSSPKLREKMNNLMILLEEEHSLTINPENILLEELRMKQHMNPKDNPEFYDLEGDNRQAHQPVLEKIISNEKVYLLVQEPTKAPTQSPEPVRRRV